MAEAASNVPTFKLVLVGDGGTGKVRRLLSAAAAPLERPLALLRDIRRHAAAARHNTNSFARRPSSSAI